MPNTYAEAHPNVLLGPLRPDLIRDEVLGDLLDATAKRWPDTIALIFGHQQLSYRELNARADHIASQLIKRGVQPGQIIGLWMARGIELLVMQAGIAKSGAAWLPFDADTPVERIVVCLDDATSPGIVSSAEFAQELSERGRPVWTAEALTMPTEAPLHQRQGLLPSHPAYVIYTSGSTGKPKGIAISHRSICHFLRCENELLGIKSSDRV